MPLTILDHPLAGHTLGRLRDRDTEPAAFRQHCDTLSRLLILEATRHMPTQIQEVCTPLETAETQVISSRLVVVPILRAGLGMVEPAVTMFPNVAVGYIGLERNEATAVAASYYCKLPNLSGAFILCLDPMLATGGSAIQAIDLIKGAGGKSITMVSVVATPEGISSLEASHPEVPIIIAGMDRGLNAQRYILPGLGDFGDRLYGTF